MAKDNAMLYLGLGALALLYLRKHAATDAAPVVVADVPRVAVVPMPPGMTVSADDPRWQSPPYVAQPFHRLVSPGNPDRPYYPEFDSRYQYYGPPVTILGL